MAPRSEWRACWKVSVWGEGSHELSSEEGDWLRGRAGWWFVGSEVRDVCSIEQNCSSARGTGRRTVKQVSTTQTFLFKGPFLNFTTTHWHCKFLYGDFLKIVDLIHY